MPTEIQINDEIRSHLDALQKSTEQEVQLIAKMMERPLHPADVIYFINIHEARKLVYKQLGEAVFHEYSGVLYKERLEKESE